MTPHERFCEWAGLPRLAAISLAGHEMIPLHVDGELAAMGALHGHELHFAAAPKFRGTLMSRKRLSEYLTPLMDRKGFLTTRVHKSTPESSRFLERMGFESTGTDGQFAHYMLSAVPFARMALEN